MDTVTNFAGTISASQFGEKAQGINNSLDKDDGTFSKLLEKQLNTVPENNAISSFESFDIPSGIDIGDFDGKTPNFNKIPDNINKINQSDNNNFERFNNGKEFTTSEILTFFPSLFASKPTLTQNAASGLFDFERKVAATSYGKYARNIVTGLGEFVTDALKLS